MASTHADTSSQERQRIDKWLWAARFYKTRSLATAAIDAGHVRHNGQQVKPAREIRIGDTLDLTIGETRWQLVVRALCALRRPAPEAQLLYEETAESLARRTADREGRRLAPVPGSERGERPSKKDRRLIHRFRGDA